MIHIINNYFHLERKQSGLVPVKLFVSGFISLYKSASFQSDAYIFSDRVFDLN